MLPVGVSRMEVARVFRRMMRLRRYMLRSAHVRWRWIALWPVVARASFGLGLRCAGVRVCLLFCCLSSDNFVLL